MAETGPPEIGSHRLAERFPALRRLTAGRRRRIPYVQQTGVSDCGAACLTMVLDYFGKQVRLDEVREAAGVSRDGSDALAILRAGRWFGLRGRGVQVAEIDDLRFVPRASVLHWKFNHFVVFDDLTPKGALVVDPAAGRRHLSREELRRGFTGVALTFEPGEAFEPQRGRPTGIGRYLRELVAQSRLVTRLLVTSVLLQVLALATPLLTGILVDRVVPRGDYSLLQVLAAGLAAVAAFHLLSSLVRAHLLLQLRTHLDAKITLEFLEHLVDLPYAYFQQRSAGDLMMRLNSNATIREILTSNALSGVLDGVLVTLYLILLWVTHWQMGLVVLGLGALRVALFLATRRRQRDLMSQSLQKQAASRGYQVELLAGIETLKAAGAESRAVELWSNLFVDELNVTLARGRLNAVFDSLISTLSIGSPFVILIFGGVLVLGGELSLGTMLAVAALATGFLTPLSTLVQTAVQLQLLGSYLERIDDVMETPREQDERTVAPAGRLRGRITLEDVSLRYGALSPLVVRGVSVDVAPGQFVAIVGPSGAGKTSLANLLLGLYRPTGGRILFDGADLATLELRSLRRQLGIVTQHPYLFGGSIRANVALSDPTLPLPRIVEAARKSRIHDDVTRMPMGYDTVLADGGLSLSGGQRQRLALARALVGRPSILLLDEATSSLDAVTEQTIQRELDQLRCTRIVIAHRLSTIRAADLILVMEQGEIVERGTHEDLLEHGGRYAELVAAQVAPKGAA
ncbi:MAG TPA: peptidase domain-containing ABC transporter [Thermoanaerobaculia bacterium]|jgi:ABC-type bacteriocin/lantibiotic exporter with double-glycine peptidase domain